MLPQPLLEGSKGFSDDFTISLVSRTSGLSEGYATKIMSDDYAELIREDLGGQFDLTISFSYGGLIMQHFAAD